MYKELNWDYWEDFYWSKSNKMTKKQKEDARCHLAAIRERILLIKELKDFLQVKDSHFVQYEELKFKLKSSLNDQYYILELTHPKGKDAIDAILYRIDSQDKRSIKKASIIEVKVREKNYDDKGYKIFRDKFEGIHEFMEDLGSQVQFKLTPWILQVTPTNTLWFKAKKEILDKEWKRGLTKKKTMGQENDLEWNWTTILNKSESMWEGKTKNDIWVPYF
jgi:hypothetical protein